MAPSASDLCRVVVGGFAIAYGVALALMAIGTFGLAGQERDPLAVVFLLPLGLPWNLLAGRAPEALRPWLVVLTPALNLVLLNALRRAMRTSATS